MTSELASSIPRLKRLLPRFRKLRVAVLGDAMLDRYILGHAIHLSPEAPVPVVEYLSEQDVPGGACNVAANIAALGARVEAFGVVGGKKCPPASKILADEAGAALLACLRKAGIGDHGVIADADRVTTLKTRVIAKKHQVVRVDRERREPLSPKTEERLFSLLAGTLKNLDGLVLSDYDKGLLGEEFADRVLHAAHKLKIPVFVKPKTSRLFAYRGVRVIVCNAKEAAQYVSRALAEEKPLEEAGRALLAHFGCAAVVITRGEHGMSIFEEDSPRHFQIPALRFDVTYARIGKPGIERGSEGRQVFDHTGAGDTVLSTLSLALAGGASLREAAVLANTAAGVVVGKLGTATVTPQELAAALEEVR